MGYDGALAGIPRAAAPTRKAAIEARLDSVGPALMAEGDTGRLNVLSHRRWQHGAVLDSSKVGSAATTLVVIRGNSGSGKSSIARSLRDHFGRGVALVEQDYLRRVLLREREQPGAVAPALIEQTARFCLDHGYHVIVEGVLAASRHAEMINRLIQAHRGRSFVFYLDVTWEETLRRHATRPQAAEFSAEDMRGWYLPRDLLGVDGEHVIPEHVTLQRSVAYIGNATGLLTSSRAASALAR